MLGIVLEFGILLEYSNMLSTIPFSSLMATILVDFPCVIICILYLFTGSELAVKLSMPLKTVPHLPLPMLLSN